jgi:predicted metal-dependent phosphoesterase TrpH
MSLFALLDEMRKQDLSTIAAHYEALIKAENESSEQRIERLRELVSVEKAESKTRIEALYLSRESTLAQIAQRYELPEVSSADSAGVTVTGENLKG